MYKYTCSICHNEKLACDEIEVNKINIPTRVTLYKAADFDLLCPVCNDCFLKFQLHQNFSNLFYLKFLNFKQKILLKIKELFKNGKRIFKTCRHS